MLMVRGRELTRRSEGFATGSVLAVSTADFAWIPTPRPRRRASIICKLVARDEMTAALDDTALLRASEAQVPGANFGDNHFRPAYARLLAALRDEARLDRSGEWAAAVRIITSLNRRRQLALLLARAPQIREQPIVAPIFILGFPRTGTTLLHNLLAADPDKRAIRLWEMREPFAPDHQPEFDADAWSRSVIATTEQLIEAGYKLAPRLADIHPLRATWPDECSWLFRNDFRSLVFGFSHFVPSYVAWLLEQDMRPAYAYYRLQLQAITHQRGGAPLVLKDPCHLWHLDALLDSFPDARIIALHRPLEQVVGSFASLCQALHEAGAEPRPSAEIGNYAVDLLAAGMQRMLAVRASLPAERVLDVHYRDLIGDPLATLEHIHRRFELRLRPAARAGAERWLSDNRELSGRHRYELEHFGLDRAAIERRFADYREQLSEVGRAL
jgi:hypothetical protein